MEKSYYCRIENCKVLLNIEINWSFGNSKHSNYICKSCIFNRSKKYYEENKKYFSDYYKDNKQEIANKQKNYSLNNKDLFKIRYKEKYKNNKEKIKLKTKKWRENNKDKRNNYSKRKRINDPLFKLRSNISGSINTLLKLNNSSKNNESCLKYLSYSIRQLKDYLESLFSLPENLDNNGKVWMTYNNRSSYNINTWNDNDSSTWVWNLDYIIPHSYFKYTTMDSQEFKDCWALENLRPYNAKNNVSEGNNRTPDQILKIKKSIRKKLNVK